MVFDLRPVGLRARLCRAVAAATALALTAAGCSYHSEYVAPQDGRARVIWGSGDVPEAEMSGAQLSSDCQAAVYGVIDDSHAVQSSARVEVHSVWVSPRSGYWAPRYYGPPIVVVQPGFAPPLPRAAVFVPRSAVPMGGHPIIVRSPGGGGGGGGHISGAASRGGSGGSSGGSSKSGGGGGSGGR